MVGATIGGRLHVTFVRPFHSGRLPDHFDPAKLGFEVAALLGKNLCFQVERGG